MELGFLDDREERYARRIRVLFVMEKAREQAGTSSLNMIIRQGLPSRRYLKGPNRSARMGSPFSVAGTGRYCWSSVQKSSSELVGNTENDEPDVGSQSVEYVFGRRGK